MTIGNRLEFTGNFSKAVTLVGNGDSARAHFRLIRNEYAGKDDDGHKKEIVVAMDFTAWRGIAETIAKNCCKGDEITINAHARNGKYEKDGETIYTTEWHVEEFAFGRPGAEKRERFEAAKAES